MENTTIKTKEIKRPKRRRHRDNPYTLSEEKDEHELVHYYVSFSDGNNHTKRVEVCKELFEDFDKNELHDLSILNEEERHWEQFDTEEEQWFRQVSIYDETDIQSELVNKEVRLLLASAISQLSKEQQRRIYMRFCEGKPLSEITAAEKCSRAAVIQTLQLGIQKLREIFETENEKYALLFEVLNVQPKSILHICSISDGE